MTDLVVGMGEIGKPLYDLLKNRNFKVDGYDIKNPIALESSYEKVHICIPFNEDFEKTVNYYKRFVEYDSDIIIHSTVMPGTSKQLGVTYSPIRGVHNDMYSHLDYFSKFYSGEKNPSFEKRFPKCWNVPDSTRLEMTKIKDLEYYGLLIAYRKMVDHNNPIYWEFMIEQDQKYGNRPILYNDEKPIGGHCITQNMNLGGEDEITKFIKKWGVSFE